MNINGDLISLDDFKNAFTTDLKVNFLNYLGLDVNVAVNFVEDLVINNESNFENDTNGYFLIIVNAINFLIKENGYLYVNTIGEVDFNIVGNKLNAGNFKKITTIETAPYDEQFIYDEIGDKVRIESKKFELSNFNSKEFCSYLAAQNLTSCIKFDTLINSSGGLYEHNDVWLKLYEKMALNIVDKTNGLRDSFKKMNLYQYDYNYYDLLKSSFKFKKSIREYYIEPPWLLNNIAGSKRDKFRLGGFNNEQLMFEILRIYIKTETEIDPIKDVEKMKYLLINRGGSLNEDEKDRYFSFVRKSLDGIDYYKFYMDDFLVDFENSLNQNNDKDFSKNLASIFMNNFSNASFFYYSSHRNVCKIFNRDKIKNFYGIEDVYDFYLDNFVLQSVERLRVLSDTNIKNNWESGCFFTLCVDDLISNNYLLGIDSIFTTSVMNFEKNNEFIKSLEGSIKSLLLINMLDDLSIYKERRISEVFREDVLDGVISSTIMGYIQQADIKTDYNISLMESYIKREINFSYNPLRKKEVEELIGGVANFLKNELKKIEMAFKNSHNFVIGSLKHEVLSSEGYCDCFNGLRQKNILLDIIDNKSKNVVVPKARTRM